MPRPLARRTVARRRVARPALAACGLTAVLAVAGCGGGDTKPGPEEAGGAAVVDTPVNADVTLVGVELGYPADGAYRAGDDAPLDLTISNTGTTPVTLQDVTGPDFTDARGSTGADLGIVVGPNASVHVGSAGAPTITLVHLSRELHSSQSIPVTFRFASTGSVTVQAVVAAPRPAAPGASTSAAASG